MKNKLLFLVVLLQSCLLFAEEKIYYLHIPKAGGTSVAALLQDQYTAEQTTGRKALLHAYGTHFYYNRIQHMTKEYKLVVFLREPIARVLSEHRFMSRTGPVDPRPLQLHMLPTEGNPIDTASNVVCRILSKHKDSDPNITIEQHLQSAKETLSQDTFFLGITEKMNESLGLLFEQLGWELPDEIPFHNVTDTSKDTYTQEVLDGVAKRNWADIELYKYGLELYEAQKERFEKKPIVKVPPTFIDDCHYTFNQKLNGFGWYLRERLDSGEYNRWVTPKEKAGIHFYLNAENSYSLRCTFFIQPKLLRDLSITVNGVAIPFTTDPTTDMDKFDWIECQAVVPKAVLKSGERTTVAFQMAATTGPAKREHEDVYSVRDFTHRTDPKGRFACKAITLEPL